MDLGDLGPRICIIGPSNSGKSTLANAIGIARNLVPVHLDQLRHLPNTDWVARPDEAFVALHDVAIMNDRWIIEGNYSQCMPQRLKRATGIVLLDVPTLTSLVRYLRRSWLERDRVGGLEGGQDSVKWDMIRHIVVATPGNRRRYRGIFHNADLPGIHISGSRELRRFYAKEKLYRWTRPVLPD